eukprot:1936824-Pyramimonas_sp.AAC.1
MRLSPPARPCRAKLASRESAGSSVPLAPTSLRRVSASPPKSLRWPQLQQLRSRLLAATAVAPTEHALL